MITYRYVKESDAEAILDIYSYYIENTAITFEYDVPKIEEFRERIKKISDEYPYIVAEENGAVIAYTYASRFRVRRAYDWDAETSIYVDKDKKGNGVGKRLYQILESALKSQNIINSYACITAEGLNRDEIISDSYRFHLKIGYKLIGKFESSGYKFGRWYDMIFMEKRLNDPIFVKDFIPFSLLTDDVKNSSLFF